MRKKNGFKVDLHCHLDGSLPINTIIRLVGENKLWDVATQCDGDIRNLVVAPQSCESLEEYLKCFDVPQRILKTPKSMEVVGYALACELKYSGVKYAEIRFAPQLHSAHVPSNEKMEHERQIIMGLLNGIKKATRFSSTKINVILCMMRNLPEGEAGRVSNTRTLMLAKEFLGKGVVGLDLAGPEARDATSKFRELFIRAREEKIPFTIHAGEAGDEQWRIDSIREAIELGARRIGHGVALVNSEELMDIVRDAGIVVECCPSSNLQTKAVIGGIENHPIKKMLRYGIKVTVNTDNMTVSNTTLDKEYELLRTIGISDYDIEIMQRNAIEGAFISYDKKKKMLDKME